VHAGYSRYFTPPPFELIGSETISKFINTKVFDKVYQIRDGIGVGAPQFGPRRGFFAGLSKQL
jgi:hypothetical protein